MVFDIIILYVLYCAVMICIGYYTSLFMTKDTYTRDELKSIMPFFAQYWRSISGSHSVLLVLFVFLISSFLGVLLPLLSDGWFLNSSIIFIIIFIIFPMMQGSLERAQVTTGGDFSDTAANIFSKYYNFIVIGFGCGTATALMYNWGSRDVIHFTWFFINFVILTICIGVAVKRAYNHE